MKQGKKHAYLGMDLYFTEKGTVKVLMTGYVDKDIDEFTKDVTTSVVSPAADHLFKINKNWKSLNEERGIIFHRLVANLLFVSKRERSDIQPTIAFLATRMQDPDEDYWNELRHLLQYLYGTREMALHLNSDDLNAIRW